MNPLQKKENSLSLLVSVVPGAKKSEVIGVHDGRLKIKLHAPPVDGKANEELIRFLAEIFCLRKNQIHLTKGETNRKKTIMINEANYETVNQLIRESSSKSG